ncbi:MAG: lycopene cyclase domain-containing protein [bacterium]|nr:lycopene cyclase domain-containing protein [bacterium]
MPTDYTYAYTLLVCFFTLVWVILFIIRKDLRREMFIMSLLAAPLGPFGDFFYQRDYYLLPILNGHYWWIYSLACGFVYGGVAAVLYETLLKEHHRIQRGIRKKQGRHYWWFWAVFLGGGAFMYVGTFLLQINSIYVSFCVMFLGALWIGYQRKDLLVEAVGSGLALMAVTTVFYLVLQLVFPGIFETQWNIASLSGLFILGIPVEEYVWAFMWGLITGPAYEYVMAIKMR